MRSTPGRLDGRTFRKGDYSLRGRRPGLAGDGGRTGTPLQWMSAGRSARGPLPRPPLFQGPYQFLVERSAKARRLRGGLLYWLAALFLRDAPIVFMNYGYAPAGAGGPALLPEDSDDRLAIQLYQRLTEEVDLRGHQVIEVSSGRGGGASYLMRYRGPRALLGVDRSRRLVEFCRRRHRVPGLDFAPGDAEALDHDPESFDVAVNVEASHCYGRMDRFLRAVWKVIRPGGLLLWTDFRPAAKAAALRKEFREGGWQTEVEEDITGNVLRAMELHHHRWHRLIEERIPAPLRGPFRETAGMKGSRIEQAMRQGQVRYLRFALRKTTAPGTL